jgi:FixJ family two-component response regulator
MRKGPAVIAVVDDEESVRKALERLIRSAGFRVETFASGSAFLESAQHAHPSCVVLDLHMPDVNGFEVQLALALAGTAVPVIVITGDDSPASRALAYDQGANAYLGKPVDETMLLDAINAAIGH